LRSLFAPKLPPLIGLDIGTSSVKLVELGQDAENSLVLENCAALQLESGCIKDGNIEKLDELAGAVRRLIKISGAKTKNVVMALPSSSVITKKIVLPGGLTDQELELQVESEANQYIPFPLEEVSLDFCILGPSTGSKDDIDVLIAASRREKVQDLQGVAEAAGLKPLIVDVKSYASRLAASRLISNMPEYPADSVVALFEVGSLTTSMQVICSNEVLYDRDQAFGGSQLTQLIVLQYGFSQEEAEIKKCRGALPRDYETTVLKPFIESLVQEISRALQFFFTSTTHNKVDLVMLAGGSANLAGLSALITRHTNFPCMVANPFLGMRIPEAVGQKKMVLEAPFYLTACGLALRRFLQ
jgi:type IV pilus assembly protein PilM